MLFELSLRREKKKRIHREAALPNLENMLRLITCGGSPFNNVGEMESNLCLVVFSLAPVHPDRLGPYMFENSELVELGQKKNICRIIRLFMGFTLGVVCVLVKCEI